MARTLDSVCKLCRREGIKLFLKGTRCDSPKCAIERRNTPPGMHNRRGKLSEYGVRLREKQKLKRFYGVLERQFQRYFAIASRSPENTGEALLSIMERRLDNIVHRLGFATSRAAARQLVSHGHVTVNGVHSNIPSMLLKAGDKVAVKGRKRSMDLVKLNQQQAQPVPDFLEITASDPPEGQVRRLPTRGDVDPRLSKDVELQEQLIIEFCSR
jgi:small subunit ribosomal protein S4